MDFSQRRSLFRDRVLPESDVSLAGYASLIGAYSLKVPLPHLLAAISQKHKKYKTKQWIMMASRYQPANNLFGQLVFALKYEGVNLSVLKALFVSVPPQEITEMLKVEPTSQYGRRIWFLYEWLTDSQLDLPDASPQKLVDVIDERLQYPGPSHPSKRHRVRNNLPGTKDFCPLVNKTEKIEKFIGMKLERVAEGVVDKFPKEILMRACAFLLLKDSKASYAIEGEVPLHNRAERWGNAIGQAGINPLSKSELERLQKIVIEDFRFVLPGYRISGGFIGYHHHSTQIPIPDHISARPKDLDALMSGLLETEKRLQKSDLHPVLAAAMIAFGFVFIHPFEDGNGRLHRYILHHVLAEMNFIAKGVVFPISAVILNKVAEYKQVLEAYSSTCLPFIQWRPTAHGNIEVLNDTIDLYRYFDATPQAEFLFACVEEAINKILPDEITYLKNYDDMKMFISGYLDMPDKSIDLLINFLTQGNGKLSKCALKKEFSLLTADEISILENKYAEIWQQ